MLKSLINQNLVKRAENKEIAYAFHTIETTWNVNFESALECVGVALLLIKTKLVSVLDSKKMK